MKLLTIPLSHFCEKARWGLDRAGVAYIERGYAPALHRAAVMPRGSSTVPVLVRGRRDSVCGSSAILAVCDGAPGAAQPLFPADPDLRREVEELVERFDRKLGPKTRVWLYSWLIQDPPRLERYCLLGIGAGQRRAFSAAFPLLMRLMKGALAITPDTHARVADGIGEELAFASERLADGRAYLAGDRFTAADLTFAALSAPAIAPPRYGGGAIAVPADQDELAGEIGPWRQTAAGQHALAMYRDWR